MPEFNGPHLHVLAFGLGLQCSGLGNEISGQRTDMFLKVSVPGLKKSVPKRRNV